MSPARRSRLHDQADTGSPDHGGPLDRFGIDPGRLVGSLGEQFGRWPDTGSRGRGRIHRDRPRPPPTKGKST